MLYIFLNSEFGKVRTAENHQFVRAGYWQAFVLGSSISANPWFIAQQHLSSCGVEFSRSHLAGRSEAGRQHHRFHSVSDIPTPSGLEAALSGWQPSLGIRAPPLLRSPSTGGTGVEWQPPAARPRARSIPRRPPLASFEVSTLRFDLHQPAASSLAARHRHPRFGR